MGEYYKYIGNYDKSYKKQCWDMAAGLQKVDGLNVSEYLVELSEKEMEGILTNAEIEELLYKRYENESTEEKKLRLKEADVVANRIAAILKEPGFTFSPVTLKYIHKTLFDGIFDEAGQFRKYNISKAEPVLAGRSVIYANYDMINDTFQYDFETEKEKSYEGLSEKDILKRLAVFSSAIWQVHPFCEGNTRTTAVFMEKYLNNLGFNVNNSLFLENSQYFRNALVRSNFADYSNKVFPSMQYLECFYDNLLFNGRNELKNRDLIVPQYVNEIVKKKKSR